MFVTKLTAVLNEIVGETPGSPFGVQEEQPLKPEEAVEQGEEHRAEDEDCLRVRLPVLIARPALAHGGEEPALEEGEPPREEHLSRVHARHVPAEQWRERDEDDPVEQDLADAEPGHVELPSEKSTQSR